MTNNIPRDLSLFRHKILQSTHCEEIVVLIQEISPFLSSEEGSSEAYDLLTLAFEALQALTAENPIEGHKQIFTSLLPLLNLGQSDEYPIQVSRSTARLRECLAAWVDQYSEPERSTLREHVLNYVLLELQRNPSPSLCWIVSEIGFRREDLLVSIWHIADQQDNFLGDTALATLTSLGVEADEKIRLLGVLHQRISHRINLPLISALSRLADVSSFPIVQALVLQKVQEPSVDRLRSLVLRILPAIAEENDSEEVQNQIWQSIVQLFQTDPERFAFDVYLGNDIAPRCDSVEVVPRLLEWMNIAQDRPEASADHRRLLSIRLENCIRPRQLQGWKNAPIFLAETLLRLDACQDTRFEGRSTTHEMLIKEAAWKTLLLMGYAGALHWFKEAVGGETNRYVQRELCDLLACFQLSPLPSEVIQWIIKPLDAKLPAASAELVATLGAIKVVRSATSQESFEALLSCGLSVDGQNLRETVNALEEVALSLARAGNTSVVSQLVDTVIASPDSRKRTAAANALEGLAAEGLLPQHAISPLVTSLREQEERDPFERRLILAALGYLGANEFPIDLLPVLRQWARDRNDWLGIQALMTLARQDDLLSQKELVAKVGLEQEGDHWQVSANRGYAEWAAHIVGLLYMRYPIILQSAVASLIETLNWTAVLEIIWKIDQMKRKTSQWVLPSEIAEALVRRIWLQQSQTFAELDLFTVAAELIPERLAQEPWENDWDGWLPEARAALADALGEPIYNGEEARTQATALLSRLTYDGQYAVRRAAYRALSCQSPQTLQSLCLMWSDARTLELLQRAAEAWAWLPTDGEYGFVALQIYQKLVIEREKAVRETINRVRIERQKRVWAKEYLVHVQQAIGKTNEEILAVWCYAKALTHVGDDTSLRMLHADLKTQFLPPHQRHWLQMIIKETKEGWQKAMSKWPEPWRSWQGAVEKGQGWLVLPSAEKLMIHYSLWQESAATRTEGKSWGGTFEANRAEVSWVGKEMTLQLADAKQGKILLQNIAIPGSATFIGQGPYPL